MNESMPLKENESTQAREVFAFFIGFLMYIFERSIKF